MAGLSSISPVCACCDDFETQTHASEIIPKKPGRTEYQRGIVSTAADGGLQVKTTDNQGSGLLSSMARANGLIVLAHHQGTVPVVNWSS